MWAILCWGFSVRGLGEKAVDGDCLGGDVVYRQP